MIVAQCKTTRADFRVRPMRLNELDTSISWAADEGWNPGLHDAEPFFVADPHGFFVGELDGRAVGSISAVRYDSSFGFIGFYIVRPEYRGGTFGPLLGDTAMDYLSGCNIGLDGVIAKVKNYQAFGFKLAYRNIRFQATADTENAARHSDVVDLSNVPFEQLAAFDRRYFPASRDAFIRAWISRPGTVALGLMDGDGLAGYGVIRPCVTGYKIGPLFADGREQAEVLYNALTYQLAGVPVFLDVPEANDAAMRLAQRYRMSRVFETARMYLHDPPSIDLDGVFGVTSFELG